MFELLKPNSTIRIQYLDYFQKTNNLIFSISIWYTIFCPFLLFVASYNSHTPKMVHYLCYHHLKWKKISADFSGLSIWSLEYLLMNVSSFGASELLNLFIFPGALTTLKCKLFYWATGDILCKIECNFYFPAKVFIMSEHQVKR